MGKIAISGTVSSCKSGSALYHGPENVRHKIQIVHQKYINDYMVYSIIYNYFLPVTQRIMGFFWQFGYLVWQLIFP